MTNEQLQKLRSWFTDYVNTFYGCDDCENSNLKLKQDHSLRVCNEMRYLTANLDLSENQSLLADTIALLHDIGRFKQFKQYQTYNDTRSVSHSALGLEVISQTGILDDFDNSEKALIEKTIEYHGIKDLPTDLDGDVLLFSQLIRDADKLDIFNLAVQYYRAGPKSPFFRMLKNELPDTNEISKQVREDILAGRTVDYKSLRTLDDFRVLQLGWVYDVNFAATLKRIKEQKYLNEIFSYLPKNSDAEKIGKKIFEYIESRIKQGS
jgi:HD superfamily phosphohydrolase